MRSDEEKQKSRLPVVFKDVEPNYTKPERRNDLVCADKYDSIDKTASQGVKLGTNGVAYVDETAFPELFQLSESKGLYVFENQIKNEEKRNYGGKSYAHSSAVVGLLDKKAQEVRNADTQSLLQYARDSLINISDSAQAQDLRRKCDTHTARELPKLRKARGIKHDELTGDPLRPGAAFHHANPKEIHTDPEDVLNPEKGRNLNKESHTEVHRAQIYDEQMFEQFKKDREKS